MERSSIRKAGATSLANPACVGTPQGHRVKPLSAKLFEKEEPASVNPWRISNRVEFEE